MKSNLKNNIIDSIKKTDCKPRWHFVVKNGLFWALGVFATLVGGVAVSTSIFILINREALPVKIIGGQSSALLAVIPYIWIILIVVFVIIGELGLRHTDRGYRFSLGKILLVHIGVSLVLGLALFSVKVGYYADQVAAKAIPHYKAVVHQELDNWFSPEQGFLLGVITGREGEKRVTLKDPKSEVWQVVLVSDHLPSQKTLLRVDRVRMVGYQTKEGVFHACRVAPFVLRGGPKELSLQHKEGLERSKEKPLRQIERMDNYLRNNDCDLAKEPQINN